MSKLKEILGEAYKEGMTPEEIEAAIESVDLVPKADTKGMIDKKYYDDLASKHAQLKRDFKAKLSEQEQQELVASEERQKVQQEIDDLRKYRGVNEHANRFIKLGYNPELAQKAAEAMYSQDYETLFSCQQEFANGMEQALLKKQTLANDQRPPAGNAQANADYASMAQKAMEAGEFAAAAYYTRLAQN